MTPDERVCLWLIPLTFLTLWALLWLVAP